MTFFRSLFSANKFSLVVSMTELRSRRRSRRCFGSKRDAELLSRCSWRRSLPRLSPWRPSRSCWAGLDFTLTLRRLRFDPCWGVKEPREWRLWVGDSDRSRLRPRKVASLLTSLLDCVTLLRRLLSWLRCERTCDCRSDDGDLTNSKKQMLLTWCKIHFNDRSMGLGGCTAQRPQVWIPALPRFFIHSPA